MTREVALRRQQCPPGTEDRRDSPEEALRAGIATFKQIHFDTESVKENVGRELVAVVLAKCSGH